MHNVKPSEYEIGIQLNKDALVAQENNYATKIVNAYIVCDLDDWPINTLNNFTLRNCLFGATNMAKNSARCKYVYTDYGIAFGGAGLWSFGKSLAKDIVTIGVDNSSASHGGNGKNNLLMLGERPTDNINFSK